MHFLDTIIPAVINFQENGLKLPRKSIVKWTRYFSYGRNWINYKKKNVVEHSYSRYIYMTPSTKNQAFFHDEQCYVNRQLIQFNTQPHKIISFQNMMSSLPTKKRLSLTTINRR